MVGIDPGRANTGIAIYEPAKRNFVSLKKYDLAGAMKVLENRRWDNNYIFVIENPNLETNLYDGWIEMQSIIRSYKRGNASLKQVKGVYSIATKRSADVGKNRAAAQDIIAMLHHTGALVVQIKPSARNRADRPNRIARDVVYLNMPTKTNRKQFEALTGYKGQSNEHSRDAATMVWAKTIKWAEMMVARQSHLK